MEMRKKVNVVVVAILTILFITSCFALFNMAKADETTETPVETFEYETRYEPEVDTSGVVTGGVTVIESGTSVTPDYAPTPAANISTVIPANVTRPENYVNGGSQIYHPANYQELGYGYDNYSYDAGDTTVAVTEEPTTEVETVESESTPSSDAKKTLDEKKTTTKPISAEGHVTIPGTGTEKQSPVLLLVIVLVLVGGIVTTSILMKKASKKVEVK